jgi:hypothetical protein
MLKKTITYMDYDDTERKEDFFFNLNKAELTEMELQIPGGMQRLLEKIVAERDSKRIIELFKDIILRSYGEKTADGKHFVKSKELTDAFTQTNAYSELFMELLNDAGVASKFVAGILPSTEPQDHLKPAVTVVPKNP